MNNSFLVRSTAPLPASYTSYPTAFPTSSFAAPSRVWNNADTSYIAREASAPSTPRTNAVAASPLLQKTPSWRAAPAAIPPSPQQQLQAYPVTAYNTRDVRLDPRVYLTMEATVAEGADHKLLEEIDQKIASYAARGPGCLLYNYDMDGTKTVTNQIWVDRDAYIEWLEYLAEDRQQNTLAKRAALLVPESKRISITGLSRDDDGIPACFRDDYRHANTKCAKNNLGFFRSV